MNLATANGMIKKGQKKAGDIGMPMAISVVDAGGHLVASARMDGTPFMSIEVAAAKAFTAAAVRLPGGDVEQLFASHPSFVVATTALFHGKFLPGDGGFPIIVDGKVIGGVGASGGSADQDRDVAAAALAD